MGLAGTESRGTGFGIQPRLPTGLLKKSLLLLVRVGFQPPRNQHSRGASLPSPGMWMNALGVSNYQDDSSKHAPRPLARGVLMHGRLRVEPVPWSSAILDASMRMRYTISSSRPDYGRQLSSCRCRYLPLAAVSRMLLHSGLHLLLILGLPPSKHSALAQNLLRPPPARPGQVFWPVRAAKAEISSVRHSS